MLPTQHVYIMHDDSISASALPGRHRVPIFRHHVSLLPAHTDGMNEGRQSMLEEKPHTTVVRCLDNDATETASPDHNDCADQVLVECRLQQAKRLCRGQPRGSKPLQSCYLHTEEPTALTLSGIRVVLPFPIPPTLYRRCLVDPVE